MLTTFQECDMSNLIELRKKYKDEFEKIHGVKLGFMSAFTVASAKVRADQRGQRATNKLDYFYSTPLLLLLPPTIAALITTTSRAHLQALQEIPAVNAVIDDETKEIVYRNYVDISVAVASPAGLVVPVSL